MKAEHRLKADHGAEHRKELRTNVLADRMGRFMQTVRQRPKGRTLLIWLLVVVVIIAAVGYFLWRRTSYTSNSELWVALYDSPTPGYVKQLADEHNSTKQGQIAEVEYLWLLLWGNSKLSMSIPVKDAKGKNVKTSALIGIANLKTGMTKKDSVEYAKAQKEMLRQLEAYYADMQERVKNDPSLGPETLYDLAVIQETLATYDPKYLNDAKATFEKIRDDFKESGFVALAEQRLKDGYETSAKMNALRDFYAEFGPKKLGEE
jgi:hypothetical protein